MKTKGRRRSKNVIDLRHPEPNHLKSGVLLPNVFALPDATRTPAPLNISDDRRQRSIVVRRKKKK